MSCSFSVTRAFAVPGLLLLLSLAAVLSLVIGAKPLPAAVVLAAFNGVSHSGDWNNVGDGGVRR
ncbi:iron-enterobactin transporter, partial [Salmonella enterica subsp. enterica serovar Wilhelmsburg]